MSRGTVVLVMLLVLVALGIGAFVAVVTLRTSTQAEYKRWHQATDSLLTHQRAAWQADVARWSARAAAARRDAAAYADSATRAEQASREQAARADTLQATLRLVGSAADSLRVYPALVTALTADREAAVTARDAWHAAFLREAAATATLTQRIGRDSLRIGELERQLQQAPKAPRPDRLLGFLPKPRPCLFGGVSLQGHGVVGAGFCASM